MEKSGNVASTKIVIEEEAGNDHKSTLATFVVAVIILGLALTIAASPFIWRQ